MSWRLRCYLACALAAVAIPVGPAFAHHDPAHTCEGDTETRGGGGEATGECDVVSDGGGSAECDPLSEEIAYYDDPPDDRFEEYLKIFLRYPPPEGMIYQAAYNCAGVHLGGPHLVADPDWADTQTARDVAKARVTPALPDPNVSPSEAVVRFPTWLWVDDFYWQEASASASQGAVTVRVDARPVRVTWDLDEGSHVCDGPGIAWSEEADDAYEAQPEESRGRGNPACTFTFRHSSTVNDDDLYHATVTVTWEFSWWLNGTPRGVFGTIDRSTSFDLRVGEIQALITDY